MKLYLTNQCKIPLHLGKAKLNSFLDQRNRIGIDVTQKCSGGDSVNQMANISVLQLASDGYGRRGA